MFAKALEKIAEKLIEKISATRFGWLLLALLAVIGGAFLAVSHFRTSPLAVETLRDPRFLTATVVAMAIGATYAISQLKQLSRYAQITLVLVILATSGYSWWQFVREKTQIFRIDVMFDNGFGLSQSQLTTFFADVEQPHFRVTLRTQNVTQDFSSSDLSFENARDFTQAHLRSPEAATQTILVTNKRLSGAGWNNLFYVTSPRFAVVSTNGVVTGNSSDDLILLRKYLSTMLPLAALHGQAMAERRTLLKDRDPTTEHGCLHDFSVDRMLMIEKLRRGPMMCATEEEEITAVFGRKTTEEYKSTLARVAAIRAP